jgi:1-acyl-sn-glycerol-3-phosphate acyltransferase
MEALGTAAFLSKDLVKYIPVMGACAYAGGTIFFNRRDAASRHRALWQTIRMCQDSTAVVVFPEGTRSMSGALSTRIHSGTIKAAYHRGLRVIPVGLDGTHQILPKSMNQLRLGGRVALRIGPPLDPVTVSSPEAFTDRIWQQVTALFHESRQDLAKP